MTIHNEHIDTLYKILGLYPKIKEIYISPLRNGDGPATSYQVELWLGDTAKSFPASTIEEALGFAYEWAKEN